MLRTYCIDCGTTIAEVTRPEVVQAEDQGKDLDPEEQTLVDSMHTYDDDKRSDLYCSTAYAKRSATS